MSTLSDELSAELIGDPIARLRAVLAASGEEPRPVAEQLLPASWKPLFQSRVAAFKPSAVLVPILIDREPSRVLLTRRSENLRQHKGQISFPGGRRDDTDVSYADAALREANEEVGIPRDAVEVIGYLEDMPTLSGFRITPVIGLVHRAFDARPHAAEVSEVIEVPLDEILFGDRFERRPLERFGVTFPTHELDYRGARIWGATAAILWLLRQRFHGQT